MRHEGKALATILRVQGLRKQFGGIRAVDGVSFDIDEGGLVGLIGPNGSGKSTLFNLVSGVIRPDGGQVLFRGGRIDGLDPNEIFSRGLVRSFQNPRLFLGMNVVENTLVPPRDQKGEVVVNAPLPSRWKGQELELAQHGLDTLNKHQLTQVRLQWATDLSGGQMKLLEVSRALMGEPKMLLLDEPTAGVAPRLAEEIFDTIGVLRTEGGLTFLVIEHRLEILLARVDRVLVMHQGRIIFDGSPADAVRDPAVVDAYLGE